MPSFISKVFLDYTLTTDNAETNILVLQSDGELQLRTAASLPLVSHTLDNHSDVTLTGATDNDLMYLSGGDWVDTEGGLTYDGTNLSISNGLHIHDTVNTPRYIDLKYTNYGSIITTSADDLRLGANNVEVIIIDGDATPLDSSVVITSGYVEMPYGLGINGATATAAIPFNVTLATDGSEEARIGLFYVERGATFTQIGSASINQSLRLTGDNLFGSAAHLILNSRNILTDAGFRLDGGNGRSTAISSGDYHSYIEGAGTTTITDEDGGDIIIDGGLGDTVGLGENGNVLLSTLRGDTYIGALKLNSSGIDANTSTGSFRIVNNAANFDESVLRIYGVKHATSAAAFILGNHVGGVDIDVPAGTSTIYGANSGNFATTLANAHGGDINIKGGNAGGGTSTFDGIGGDIVIDGGIKANSGTNGNVLLAINRGYTQIGASVAAVPGLFNVGNSIDGDLIQYLINPNVGTSARTIISIKNFTAVGSQLSFGVTGSGYTGTGGANRAFMEAASGTTGFDIKVVNDPIRFTYAGIAKLTIDNTLQTFSTVVAGVDPTADTHLVTRGWANNAYLIANETITLSGDITGSGTTAITTTISSGAVDIAMLSATGTASSSTYLRGDNTWAAPVSGGTISGSIADNQIAIGATTSNSIEGSTSLTYTSATGTLGFTSSIGATTLQMNNIHANVNTDSGIQLSTLTTGRDPYISFGIDSTRSYAWGVDNDDSDKFKLVTAAASNTAPSIGAATTLLDVTSAGLFTFGSNVGGGGSSNFLRADGSWAVPSTGSVNVVASKGILAAETVRVVHDTGIYTFNTHSSTLGTGTPAATYYSTIAFGRGSAGSVQVAGSWHSTGGLYYRSLRDTTDSWTDWKQVMITTDTASTVTVTNSTSATTYPIVWHNNSNSLYDTATLTVQPSTGTLNATKLNASGESRGQYHYADRNGGGLWDTNVNSGYLMEGTSTGTAYNILRVNTDNGFKLQTLGGTGGTQRWYTNNANYITFSGTTITASLSGNATSSSSCSGNAATATWADQCDVNSSDTGGTNYSLVWHSGDTLYRSSWFYINRDAKTLYTTDLNVSGNLYPGNSQFYLDASTRTGLCRTVETGSNGYAGYETYFSGTARYSWMGSESLFGLYDESEAHWAIQYNSHASTASVELLYGVSVTKLQTTLAGITVTGTGSATNWSATSDRRLKKNIKYGESWLKRILQLGDKVVRYDWKNEEEGTDNIGLIAQDVLKIAPEFVGSWDKVMNFEETRDPDNMKPQVLKTYYNLDYNKLVAPLCGAFAESYKETEELKAEVGTLKSDLEALKLEMRELINKLK